MVPFNDNKDRKDAHSILDYDLDRLESDFRDALQTCNEREQPSAFPTLDTLYCVGSYARGEADRDSDLDLVAEFSGSKMNVRNEISKTVIATCLSEDPELFLQNTMKTPATEADVIPAFNDGVWLILERFFRDTRTGETFTDKAVYDITNKQYIDRATVTQRANTQREADKNPRQPNR